jgi:hypothetical protein
MYVMYDVTSRKTKYQYPYILGVTVRSSVVLCVLLLVS